MCIRDSPDAIHRALLDDLYASHCEMVPRKHLYPTLRAQRLRDAFMARVMTSNSSHQAPVVLLAGSEHVRLDRGVPYYLQGRHRSTESPSIATVGLIELSERTSCNQPWNTPAHKDLIAKFDYIWITEAAKRKDPCEDFAEALRKIHHSASGVTKSVRP